MQQYEKNKSLLQTALGSAMKAFVKIMLERKKRLTAAKDQWALEEALEEKQTHLNVQRRKVAELYPAGVPDGLKVSVIESDGKLGMSVAEGTGCVTVLAVNPGSIASPAGIREGMSIVALDGVGLPAHNSLTHFLARVCDLPRPLLVTHTLGRGGSPPALALHDHCQDGWMATKPVARVVTRVYGSDSDSDSDVAIVKVSAPPTTTVHDAAGAGAGARAEAKVKKAAASATFSYSQRCGACPGCGEHLAKRSALQHFNREQCVKLKRHPFLHAFHEHLATDVCEELKLLPFPHPSELQSQPKYLLVSRPDKLHMDGELFEAVRACTESVHNVYAMCTECEY